MRDVNNIDKGINWLDRALEIVEKYKLGTILKAFGIILLIALLIAFLKNPTYIFEKYDEWKEKEHSERMEVRMENNHKLQSLTEKTLYKVDASRIIILEMHNGLENANGLPFSKCSATYEALNDGVYPVANQYQNTNLSLMPFATYLLEHKYWYGDVEDIEQIDRGLYHKMAGNGTVHFAACVIEGVDKPLAFVFISWQEKPEHNCKDIKKIAEHASIETAVLLELNKRNK